VRLRETLLLLLGVCLCDTPLVAWQEPVLDLTSPPPRHSPDPLGTEIAIRLSFSNIDHLLGRSHETEAQRGLRALAIDEGLPRPPLSVSIVGSALSGSQDKPQITLDLRIRNEGDTSYLFPVSTDPDRSSVLPGQKGRRLMLFKVILQTVGPAGKWVDGTLMTEGSETYPKSLVELKPGVAIVVRIKANAAEIVARAAGARNVDVEAYAALTESLLEDSGYILKPSGEVSSKNSVSLQIPR